MRLMNISETNVSSVWYTGSVWNQRNGSVCTVLGQSTTCVGKRNTPNRKYWVAFCDEGFGEYYVEAYGEHISNGVIKNKRSPAVCGVGCMGDGLYSAATHKREYVLWSSMLNRCYNKKRLNVQPSYVGCSVCIRWLSFQNFCEDLPKISMYDLWLNDRTMQLDKDILIEGNKEYSLDTCMFVSDVDNAMKACGRQDAQYKATRISDGYVELFSNQSAFARKHTISAKGISACINKVNKTCSGWMFE